MKQKAERGFVETLTKGAFQKSELTGRTIAGPVIFKDSRF